MPASCPLAEPDLQLADRLLDLEPFVTPQHGQCLAAIEWRELDRKAGVMLVERTCAYGVTKAYGKTARSRRRVPLSTRALEALDATPRRLNVRLVFPGMRAGPGGRAMSPSLHNACDRGDRRSRPHRE
jgi:integrase